MAVFTWSMLQLFLACRAFLFELKCQIRIGNHFSEVVKSKERDVIQKCCHDLFLYEILVVERRNSITREFSLLTRDIFGASHAMKGTFVVHVTSFLIG